MKEVFKDIEGYEGLYQVSNLGRVKSLNYNKTGNERILSSANNGLGYYFVDLHKKGKKEKHFLHRLVAEAFLENPNNLPDVNHIDQNKQNNTISNLEWCTRKYNVRYSKAKKVGCYKDNILIKTYQSMTDCIKDGFWSSQVSKCCRGLKSQYKGFQWRYE